MPRKSSKRKSPKRKSPRKSPSAGGMKAKDYEIGHVIEHGGFEYEVAERKNGVRYWKKMRKISGRYVRSSCGSLKKKSCYSDPNCHWSSGYKSKSGKKISGKCKARSGVRKGEQFEGPFMEM